MIRRLLAEISHHAVFGVLCVLDGSRAVEDYGPEGYFELHHVKDNVTSILSGPRGAALHELL
jgi:hypothetical protein